MSSYENHSHRKSNKVLLGFLIILIGVFLFLRQTGLIPYVSWDALWPLMMIALGIFIGIRNSFSTNAPFILIAIGIFHLIPGFSFTIGSKVVDSEDLAIPALLVIVGLVIILKSRNKKHGMKWKQPELVSDNNLRADIVFGGRKEIITSKEFKGGKVTVTFGGCEINLLQADSPSDNIVLDLKVAFGGCEIIVPSNWEIKNEIEPIFGSVEDKRTIRPPDTFEKRKTLFLKGTCSFGGIEVKSF